MDDDIKLTYKESSRNGEVLKLLCEHCRCKTRHTVVASIGQSYSSEWITGSSDYCVVRCNGCESQQFCLLDSNSEDMDHVEDPKTGRYETIYPETIKQYPPVNVTYEKLATYYAMPHELRLAYNEAYDALCAKLPKLASVGMRLCIEAICMLNDIKGNTLPKRIEALCKNQIISPDMRDVLLSIKNFGDRGAHSLRVPKPEELKIAWEALNLTVRSIYGIKDTNESIQAMRGFDNRYAPKPLKVVDYLGLGSSLSPWVQELETLFPDYGARIIGVYVYGSAVLETLDNREHDWSEESSDVDFTVVVDGKPVIELEDVILGIHKNILSKCDYAGKLEGKYINSSQLIEKDENTDAVWVTPGTGDNGLSVPQVDLGKSGYPPRCLFSLRSYSLTLDDSKPPEDLFPEPTRKELIADWRKCIEEQAELPTDDVETQSTIAKAVLSIARSRESMETSRPCLKVPASLWFEHKFPQHQLVMRHARNIRSGGKIDKAIFMREFEQLANDIRQGVLF